MSAAEPARVGILVGSESDRARMQPASDAELIDTTHLHVDDVVARIEELIRARTAAAP